MAEQRCGCGWSTPQPDAIPAPPAPHMRLPPPVVQSKGRHSAALDLLHRLSQQPEQLPAPAQGASAGERCNRAVLPGCRWLHLVANAVRACADRRLPLERWL